VCPLAACTGKSNFNFKSNWKLHLAQKLLLGIHGSVQRGNFDKIPNASAPAGLGLEDALTQPKVSPSFGFSPVSHFCRGSLLGITHDPTATASSCPTAGKGHPLVCGEQSVISVSREPFDNSAASQVMAMPFGVVQRVCPGFSCFAIRLSNLKVWLLALQAPLVLHCWKVLCVLEIIFLTLCYLRAHSRGIFLVGSRPGSNAAVK